jgi:hypothetical protein
MKSRHVNVNYQSAVAPRRSLRIGSIAGTMCVALATFVTQAIAQSHDGAIPLGATTEHTIKMLYRNLIEAENRHDIVAVQPFVWNSSTAVFVAKTATPAEGGWAGFWGADTVLEHLRDIYKGPFQIAPDYANEKEVALSTDVIQTYVPVKITVAYAGQTPVPKPFLMILEWVRTESGWKMATDIALPIPS